MKTIPIQKVIAHRSGVRLFRGAERISFGYREMGRHHSGTSGWESGQLRLPRAGNGLGQSVLPAGFQLPPK